MTTPEALQENPGAEYARVPVSVLIVPMYSKRALNADSNYLINRHLLTGFQKLYPRSFRFTLLFPSRRSGYHYVDDHSFSTLQNTTRVAFNTTPRKMGAAVSYDAAFFDKLFRTYHFDAVLCHTVEIAHHLTVASQPTYDTRARATVFAHHHFPIHETLTVPESSVENVLLQQLSGALLCDHNLYNSRYCRQLVHESAQKYLTPQQIDRIKAKEILLPYGLVDARYRALYDAKPYSSQDDLGLRIVYNHRLQSYKNYKTTFEILDSLYQQGLRFRVLYTSADRERSSRILDYPFTEIHTLPNHSDYLKKIAPCDVNTTNSQHESFCQAALESLALGHTLVAPNNLAFPELTPPDDPFLYTNTTQQRAQLEQLVKNPQLAHARRKTLQNFSREHFSTDQYIHRLANLLLSTTQKEMTSPKDARQLLLHVLDQAPEQKLPLPTLHAKLSTTPVNGRLAFGPQSAPLSKIAKLLRELGCSITIENSQQVAHLK